jgi:hypothetical protein
MFFPLVVAVVRPKWEERQRRTLVALAVTVRLLRLLERP